MRQKYTVTGMTCSACSAHVEKAVCKLEGVSSVNVNLLGGSMQVDYDPVRQSDESIIAAVVASGYGADLAGRMSKKAASAGAGVPDMQEELKGMKWRLAVSFCFFIPLFYLTMGHMVGLPIPSFFHGPENALSYALTQLLLLLPIVYVNDKYYKVGFKTLFHRSPNMDSLIALGSAAALVYGLVGIYQIGWGLGHGDMVRVEQWSMDLYFESAGTILTLITLGKYMETRSKGKTGEAIARLMDLAPKTATVLRYGKEEEIPVEEVAVGDLIRVRPGQSIPVDGEITEGISSIDESALTGESLPVDKGPGDKVAAASINKSGSFTFKATRVGDDTTLAQMIALVDEAASSKAPIAKLADKVAGVFVPAVIGIAVVTAAIWLVATGGNIARALTSGVAVLVISCPCALGLATPVAIMVGTGKGAENGILFKSAEALEQLRSIQTVVLDKTGTVTQGKPVVTDIKTFGETGEEELLCLAASLEKLSEHPLAQAVVTEAESRKIPLAPAERFSAVHGRGVSAHIQGAEFLAGNRFMMEENRVELTAAGDLPVTLAEEGKTPLFFAQDGKLIGILAVADTVKPTSAAAIKAMRELGLDVVMLTGDNRRTANAIARQLDLTDVVAEVLPQDKEKVIAQIQAQGKKVAMVGDGINDAPALARSDVGLAIGAGTDVAIESADVVLMKSDLLDAVTAVELSRATIRNIKQNLFWAFFYNAVCIPVAAGVLTLFGGPQLNPMIAAAAMSMSSVCVVSNALRLKLFKPRKAGEGIEASVFQPEEKNQEFQPIKKEEKTMTKTVTIEGMMCQNCVKHAATALNALPGVTATVDLDTKTATVTGDVTDEAIKQAIADAGYEVTNIQ